MKHRHSFALALAFAATLTCASTTASAAPVNLAPGLLTTGGPVVVYAAPTAAADPATMPNATEFHSAVSLRLAAAANRSVDKATASPDAESPRTLNFKAVPGAPQQLTIVPAIQEAKVSWVAPALKGFPVEGYILTYQPGDGYAELGPTVLTMTLKNLTGDTEYTVGLQAWNSFGGSVLTFAHGDVQSPPPPPPVVDYAPAPAYSGGGNTHIIAGVTFHYQAHNLSCEEANTWMALSHQGLNITEDMILARLGVDNTPPVIVNGVLVSWGNPDRAFVGNVNGLERNHTGYQANPAALMRVINSYGGRVIEWAEPGVHGYIGPEEIYAQVRADHPVIAYATYDWNYHPRHDYRSEDGNMVAWIGPYDAHVYTVVGVSSGSVLVNDPIRGQYWVSKGSFEAAYSDFNMAIVFA